jgi:DNA repair protein RecN (Recombination protein N)
MLRYLNIQRLALIEALAIDLAPGLTVLTGETGAGKSIVIDAISLITGGRASGDLVRTGADTCSVQAVIETIGNKELIVRREVSSTGRGRAFLDDTLVTAASLKAALDGQIELHGQHEQQRLLSPAAQVEVLDTFAGLAGDRIAVATAHGLVERPPGPDALSMDERERAARVEWLAFQLSEFDKVAPGPPNSTTCGPSAGGS